MSYFSLAMAVAAYLLCVLDGPGRVGLLLPGLALLLAALAHLPAKLVPANFAELAQRVSKAVASSQYQRIVASATLVVGLIAIIGFFLVYFLVLAGQDYRGSPDARAALCLVFAGFSMAHRGFMALQDQSLVADTNALLHKINR